MALSSEEAPAATKAPSLSLLLLLAPATQPEKGKEKA